MKKFLLHSAGILAISFIVVFWLGVFCKISVSLLWSLFVISIVNVGILVTMVEILSPKDYYCKLACIYLVIFGLATMADFIILAFWNTRWVVNPFNSINMILIWIIQVVIGVWTLSVGCVGE